MALCKRDKCSFYSEKNARGIQRRKDKKLYKCFVDLEKAFDSVLRRVMQWALRKKGLPDILVKVMMGLYKGSKIEFKVGSEFSEQFYIEISVHQGSVLLLLLFATVVDVVTENAREGLMKEVFTQMIWY